jgi:hypothetical protein
MSQYKTPLRTTTMPAEVALDVVRASRCFKGFALNLVIAGQEVVIMARTMKKLSVIFESLHPGQSMRTDACPEVVLIARASVQLDEEL